MGGGPIFRSGPSFARVRYLPYIQRASNYRTLTVSRPLPDTALAFVGMLIARRRRNRKSPPTGGQQKNNGQTAGDDSGGPGDVAGLVGAWG